MNFSQNIPIFLQIARIVEQNIVQGTWIEGERISSTRELGVELSVNPATVMRAYDHLTELSLIEQQRGLGYFVVWGAKSKILQMNRQEFFEITLPQFFDQMRAVGATWDEILEIRNINIPLLVY